MRVIWHVVWRCLPGAKRPLVELWPSVTGFPEIPWDLKYAWMVPKMSPTVAANSMVCVPAVVDVDLTGTEITLEATRLASGVVVTVCAVVVMVRWGGGRLPSLWRWQ